MFFTLTVIGATLVLLKEVWEVTGDSWVSTLNNMGTGMAWVVIDPEQLMKSPQMDEPF